MSVDIYFKLPSDRIFNPNGLEEDNEVEIFLQQLDMILSTKKGSVFGDPEFGLALEQYLWTFSGGSGSIKQEIYQQITQYTDNIENIDYEIDVNFIQGEIYDSILVDVKIDGTKVAGYLVAR
jgi:hypothetical protein